MVFRLTQNTTGIKKKKLGSKADAYKKDLGNPLFSNAECWDENGGLRKLVEMKKQKKMNKRGQSCNKNRNCQKNGQQGMGKMDGSGKTNSGVAPNSTASGAE